MERNKGNLTIDEVISEQQRLLQRYWSNEIQFNEFTRELEKINYQLGLLLSESGRDLPDEEKYLLGLSQLPKEYEIFAVPTVSDRESEIICIRAAIDEDTFGLQIKAFMEEMDPAKPNRLIVLPPLGS